jgi:succinate-semialdehyde dehydrogenase/glutarate-semialdehyde dehydrogenase
LTLIASAPLTDTTAAPATLLINGEWISAGTSFDVSDPATGEVIGRISDGGITEAKLALDAADAAFPLWREVPVESRSAILKAAAEAVRRQAEELAHLMSRENGKPLAEARGEILNCARTLEWSAEEARRAFGRVLPNAAHGPSMVVKTPVGPTLAIAPWNFPGSMLVRKMALAIASGSTVIAKPAAQTSLIAVALTRIINDAGLPEGVLNLVTSTQASKITAALMSDERLRKVSFTGSTRVGLELAAGGNGRVRRLSLELGGHSPAVVLPDADIERTAASIVAAKFANNGQSCTAINRVYLPRENASALTEAIVAKARQLVLGHGLDEDTTTGPLINESGLEKVDAQVRDALERGATLLTGGKRWQPSSSALTGAFYEPTVISGVSPEALISTEETFGPVLPIYVYDTLDEAVSLANGSEYGLAAYIFGKDMQTLWKTFDALEFGVIGVNDPFPVRPELPFGGFKNSGQEREGGSEGIEAYLETKAISIRW